MSKGFLFSILLLNAALPSIATANNTPGFRGVELGMHMSNINLLESVKQGFMVGVREQLDHRDLMIKERARQATLSVPSTLVCRPDEKYEMYGKPIGGVRFEPNQDQLPQDRVLCDTTPPVQNALEGYVASSFSNLNSSRTSPPLNGAYRLYPDDFSYTFFDSYLYIISYYRKEAEDQEETNPELESLYKDLLAKYSSAGSGLKIVEKREWDNGMSQLRLSNGRHEVLIRYRPFKSPLFGLGKKQTQRLEFIMTDLTLDQRFQARRAKSAAKEAEQYRKKQQMESDYRL